MHDDGNANGLDAVGGDEFHPEYQAAVEKHQGKDLEKIPADQLWQDAHEVLAAAMYYATGLLFATMGTSAGSEGLLTRVYNKFAKQPGDPEANVVDGLGQHPRPLGEIVV